jgi:hypothetical protein
MCESDSRKRGEVRRARGSEILNLDDGLTARGGVGGADVDVFE